MVLPEEIFWRRGNVFKVTLRDIKAAGNRGAGHDQSD